MVNFKDVEICDDTRSLILPHQHESINVLAVDIGGSLAKVVYMAPCPASTSPTRLSFRAFETSNIDECIRFLKNIVDESMCNGTVRHRVVLKATGGGSIRYHDLLLSEIGADRIVIQREDEMACLITGLDFLIEEIPYEVFAYSEGQPPTYESRPPQESMYPYMLVNIGSGVSILKVTGSGEYERVGGTSLGGGTMWGLGSIISGEKSFDRLLDMTVEGDNKNVDLLVGDIYGTDYNKIGLKASTIASSMGKAFREPHRHQWKNEDVCQSLLYMLSNNIGQIAYLHAKLHNIQRIYFGGFFIRGKQLNCLRFYDFRSFNYDEFTILCYTFLVARFHVCFVSSS